MLATMTSKGQVTLPKEIRDKLGLTAGAKLDFWIEPDGRIIVRKVEPNPLSIRGLLKSPLERPPTVAEMDAGIARYLAEKHAKKKKR